VNRDGRITQQDIEDICIRYLCQGVGGSSYYPTNSVPVLPISQSKQYPSNVQEKLDVATRLFRMFDLNNDNYITESEVTNLLNETYRQVGMSYQPRAEDVKHWMSMADTNSDGRVSLEEYTELVLKSLEKAGLLVRDN